MDINLMNQACVILKSHTNFKCFSKSKTDVKTYNCEIFDALWIFKNGKLVFTIKANRFLRNMVRAIVGTMVQVGLKKISLDYFQEILISQDRTKAGPSAPAHALYLSNIEYPKEIRSNE
jgi:tRNA pseudouridine38-40 synthase